MKSAYSRWSPDALKYVRPKHGPYNNLLYRLFGELQACYVLPSDFGLPLHDFVLDQLYHPGVQVLVPLVLLNLQQKLTLLLFFLAAILLVVAAPSHVLHH